MLSAMESIGENRLAQAPMLELHDIQATVLRPRPAPYFGTHVLLRVEDARSGCEALRRLKPYVDSAAHWWRADRTWLSMAVTYAGLQAIGLPQEALQSFP